MSAKFQTYIEDIREMAKDYGVKLNITTLVEGQITTVTVFGDIIDDEVSTSCNCCGGGEG